MVKLVAGTSHPLLTSYQQSLPLLPLPSIKDTCTKVTDIYIMLVFDQLCVQQYLASVRPLCDDKEFEEKKRLVEHFRVYFDIMLVQYYII